MENEKNKKLSFLMQAIQNVKKNWNEEEDRPMTEEEIAQRDKEM